MMTDPIADMLTRLRNASAIRQKRVTMPASKSKVGLATVLMQEGFISTYEVQKGEPSSTLVIELKYGPDGEQVIRRIDRVSKPGRRIYMKVKDLPRILHGMGIQVLSTPKGIVSDRVARELSVGGEVLCKVF